MCKLIRFSVKTTVTETWTLVWLPDDEPLSHRATVLYNPLNPKEKPDETLPVTLTATADQPSASAPRASLNAPATTPDPPSDGVSTRSIIGRQRQRSRGRRAADNPQS